jgi:DNA primase
MARVSEEEIQRLKREIALERLAAAAGVALKRHGKDWIGRCPFHDDRSPSLVITPEKNLWHCLGECQAGGTVIDWVMRAERVSFRHAVELLRERYLPSLAAEASRPVAAPPKPAELDRSASDEELLLDVVRYYHDVQNLRRRAGHGFPRLLEIRLFHGFARRPRR